jgi:hypothetical protein
MKESKKQDSDKTCIVRGCVQPATKHGCLCLGCFLFLTIEGPSSEPFRLHWLHSRARTIGLQEEAESRIASCLNTLLFRSSDD